MVRYEACVQAAEEAEKRLATFRRMIAQKERDTRGRRFVVRFRTRPTAPATEQEEEIRTHP
ncbi:hypothetical protein NS228_06075 [Methylobacterium indicum]|nr:hypothetical protein [Methylobacterium indicum]KTS30882.1 hypothetical protein NS229_14755 [Methylobacterium indicum]KTS41530.1 hypothetical protein NS228_06075 [Methylobacterium indicum]